MIKNFFQRSVSPALFLQRLSLLLSILAMVVYSSLQAKNKNPSQDYYSFDDSEKSYLEKEAELLSEGKPNNYLPEYGLFKERAAGAFLHYLRSLFQTQYAPWNWKQTRYGWNPDKELLCALEDLKAIKEWKIDSVKPIFSRLMGSANDLHVDLLFDDQRLATIPIEVDLIEGKVLVTHSSCRSIQRGDQILKMNGEAPLEHIKKIFYNFEGMLITRPHFLLDHAFVRSGAKMALPAVGEKLVLEILQKGRSKQYTLDWHRSSAHLVQNAEEASRLEYRLEKEGSVASSSLPKKKLSMTKRFARFDQPVGLLRLSSSQKESLARSYREFYGEAFWRKSFEPKEKVEASFTLCGAVEWALFKEEELVIGYLKIPDFAAIDFYSLDKVLQEIERKSDGLLIDIRGNKGGYDLSCMGLAARLTEKPLVNVMNSIILDEAMAEKCREDLSVIKLILEDSTEEELEDSFLGSEEELGYPFTLDFVRALKREASFCLEEWENGYTCSRFEPLRGIDKIPPHPTVRYTKPLYLLIDERCCSCGDLFPALLKDNQRATLLGRTTAGAGGCVEQRTVSNIFGVQSLSLTRSFLLRNNKLAIEDIGISPHFEHKKTALLDPQQEKKKAILFAAEEIRKKRTEGFSPSF